MDATVHHLPTLGLERQAQKRALTTRNLNDHPFLKSSAARHVDEAISIAEELWTPVRVPRRTRTDVARAQ
jgi:hypothetical protein